MRKDKTTLLPRPARKTPAPIRAVFRQNNITFWPDRTLHSDSAIACFHRAALRAAAGFFHRGTDASKVGRSGFAENFAAGQPGFQFLAGLDSGRIAQDRPARCVHGD